MFTLFLLSLFIAYTTSEDTKPVTSTIDSNFYKFLAHSTVIVDKTLLIKSFLETEGKVFLFTYPTKSGRSLNLDMIKSFLNIEVDGNDVIISKEKRASTKWFFGSRKLNIAKPSLKIKITENGAHTYYDPRDLNGEFPVINLKFEVHIGLNRPIINYFKTAVAIAFRKHSYIGRSNSKFNIYADYGSENSSEGQWSQEASPKELVESIHFLSSMLYNHWKKKVFIFVDQVIEPGVPTIPFIGLPYSAGPNATDFLNNTLPFMQLFFQKTFNENEYLEKAFITASYPSILLGANNVIECNLLTGQFAEYFGFTKPEVSKFLAQHGKSAYEEDIADWHQGYNIHGTTIYNPFSVARYVEGVRNGSWTQHAPQEILLKCIRHPNVLYAFSVLLTGEPIKVQLPMIKLEDIFLLETFAFTEPMIKSTADVTKAALNFAMSIGYLTSVSNEIVTDLRKPFQVKIPTKDIRIGLWNGFESHFYDQYDRWAYTDQLLVRALQQLFHAPHNTTLRKEFAGIFERFLPQVNSEKFHEQFTLRAIISAYSVLRIPEVKIVEAQSDCGQGYVDLPMIYQERLGVIFEFTADKTAAKAYQQLISRKYSMLEFSNGRYKQIKQVLRVAMNYNRKSKKVASKFELILNGAA